MPPKKRSLEEEESPGVETRSSKSRRKSSEQTSQAETTPSKTSKQTQKKKKSQGAKKGKVSSTAGKNTKKTKTTEQQTKRKSKKEPGKENRAPRGGQRITLGPGEHLDDDGEIRKEGEEEEIESDGSEPYMTIGPGEFINSDGEIEQEDAAESETTGQDAAERPSSSQSDKVPMEKKDPYEYILMRRPPYDYEDEDKKKPLGQRHTEKELEKLWEKENEDLPFDEPASTKPDHKWIITRGSWIKFADAMRERWYRSPDSLGMYIYNDFEAYGLLELVENHVQAFATEYAKKSPNLKDMWISLSSVAHFLHAGDIFPLGMIDDGERLKIFLTLLGRAYLAMLNSLDYAKQLNPNSEFRDLAIISGLFMVVPEMFVDSYDKKRLDWKLHVQNYVETNKIDTRIVFGSPDINLNDGTDAMDKRSGVPKDGPDRWRFKTAFQTYKRNYSDGRAIGGTHFDITKMSRGERARFAFDKKDPLKHISVKDLREGNLMLR